MSINELVKKFAQKEKDYRILFFKVTDGTEICYIEINLCKDSKTSKIEVRIQEVSKIVKMQQSLSDKIY